MIELPVLGADALSRSEKPSSSGASSKTRFWRSPSHLKKTDGYEKMARNEFMPGASEPPSKASRRQFLQLMGASMAMAGLSACRRPVKTILPYTRKPEEVIPGIERYYATSMPFRGIVRGLLVESHEERPTKAEGNPEHPSSLGTTSHFEQASVLMLYDPDRSDTVLREGSRASWQDFVDFTRDFAVGASNKRIAVLAEPTSSPTVLALREQLRQRYPNLQWITYSAEGGDPGMIGLQQAFGQRVRPLYRFSEAEVIVSLDADFLGPTEQAFINNTQAFAASRRLDAPEDDMSRLYVVESTYTITGGKADHRLRMRASDIPAFAAALAAEMGVGGAQATIEMTEQQQRFVRAMASDLQEAGSRGVVLAGETQPPGIHALCAAINAAIGSVGETMVLLDLSEEQSPRTEENRPQDEQLVDLVSAMRGGQVDALFMLGTNPVYSAPAALGFAEAMQNVQNTIHLGLYVDETAVLSEWHMPRAHYLEAWGDGRAYDGTLSVIQPLIAPLYDEAHSEIEVLNAMATGLDEAGYDIVRRTWRDRLSGNFEERWRRLLHDGFLSDSGYPTVTASASSANVSLPPAVAADDLELVFRLDPTVLDGFFSNNAWCQELPDPTTKITWDNVAIMSARTAELLDLNAEYNGGQYYVDVIELSLGGESVPLPVWILPGHPDGSISVTLGYGRTIKSNRAARDDFFFSTDEATDIYGHGPLANGVGQNVAPLKPTHSARVAVGVDVRKTGERYMIVSTQDHGALDPEARPVVRAASLEAFRENPNFIKDMDPPSPDEPWNAYPELWEDHPRNEPDYKDNPYYVNQWGMVIDLNTCTGCNACVIACQSENNIPVVGKESVSHGREMHWMRIDRYYVTPHLDGLDAEKDELDPADMVFQPMLCQHCENAPCEPVCPVAATSHSPDGINEMTYNRCIGTRYCSNNCPYKVRRYNWFNWTGTLPQEVQMAMNPDVTVRFRGVMEKCTYCVQRVRLAGRRAQIENREIQDGEVLTACQQVCPADAIIFGDINDPNSTVSRKKRNPRRYEVLAELNVKPRTSYLGIVRNLNPLLAEQESA